jgi:hypothetical protein
MWNQSECVGAICRGDDQSLFCSVRIVEQFIENDSMFAAAVGFLDETFLAIRKEVNLGINGLS